MACSAWANNNDPINSRRTQLSPALLFHSSICITIGNKRCLQLPFHANKRKKQPLFFSLWVSSNLARARTFCSRWITEGTHQYWHPCSLKASLVVSLYEGQRTWRLSICCCSLERWWWHLDLDDWQTHTKANAVESSAWSHLLTVAVKSVSLPPGESALLARQKESLGPGLDRSACISAKGDLVRYVCWQQPNKEQKIFTPCGCNKVT